MNGSLEELHILVVEDHDFQRMVLTGMLEDLGIVRISEAPDGQQALDIIDKRTVDIIFLDLKMEGMDGVEFLRHLGPRSYSGSVVLASALEESLVESVSTMARMENVPILGLLEKPVTGERIRNLLEAHLNGAPVPGYEADELMTAEDVHRGLLNREMIPWFQPKVRFSNGVVTGAEALVRWQHPQHGVLPPSSFLPAIEEQNLMDALTEIVTQCAVCQCAAWQEAGLNLSVSVNVEGSTVSRRGFANYFADLVRGYGLEPRKVVIEITESTVTKDLSACIGNLAQLRMHGFGISIDDFGTGYSSMSQLKNLPFSELKIDRSFVSGVTKSKNNQAIARGSIQIATELGIKTTTEGIENWEEWDYFCDIGADLCQGYLSGKPVPGGEMVACIEDWQTRYAARNAQ